MINYVENSDGAEKLVEELKAEGVRSFAYKADVSNESQVIKMFEETFKEFGTIRYSCK